MIPKILHFTWKTAELPGYLARYYRSWEKVEAGWDIRLWTDATMRALVADRYPALLPTYDAYPHPIERADIFRAVVLHAFGGIYSDLDVKALRPVDALLALDCFVGVEPFEHLGPDRRHAGMGYVLSNAFMGSVADHPLWAAMLAAAPAASAAAGGDIFNATGPSFLTGTALRLPVAERPVGLLPEVWSPRRDGGKPTHTSGDDIARLERLFAAFAGEGRPLVSHDWLTTWVPYHVKHPWVLAAVRAPNVMKWRNRAKKMPEIANVGLKLNSRVFDEQAALPLRRDERIFVGLYLPEGSAWNPALAGALAALDYPKAPLTVGIFTGATGDPALAALSGMLRAAFPDVRVIGSGATGPALRNAMLAAGAEGHDRVLLVAGDIGRIPPQSLAALAGSGVDIAVPARVGEGRDTYRYAEPPAFRDLYKHGARDGLVQASIPRRGSTLGWPAFRLLPVDGISPRFVLVSAKAIRAGVKFPETPYKFHADGEGLPWLARDLGFDTAARNDIIVDE